jgi:hypothetical protein
MQSQLGALGLGAGRGKPSCLVEGVDVKATKLPTSASEKIAERSSVFIRGSPFGGVAPLSNKNKLD